MTKKSKGTKFAALISGMALGGMIFTLCSSSSIEKSNELAIDDLYDQVTELDQEMASLKVMSEADLSSEPLMGEIAMFAGNFAPRGWAFCDGKALSVSENPALFTLLGNTYGGDGKTTFALPDLRGRMPLHRSDKIQLGRKGRITSKITHHGPEKHDDEIFTLGQDGYTAVNFIIALEGKFPDRD